MRKKKYQERVVEEVFEFDELVAHQPLLNDVLIYARSFHKCKEGDFCRALVWHTKYRGNDSLKVKLWSLVGWGYRGNVPFLKTEQAWKVASETLLDALPPCRNCCCVDENEKLRTR